MPNLLSARTVQIELMTWVDETIDWSGSIQLQDFDSAANALANKFSSNDRQLLGEYIMAFKQAILDQTQPGRTNESIKRALQELNLDAIDHRVNPYPDAVPEKTRHGKYTKL